MTLEGLKGEFTVCKLHSLEGLSGGGSFRFLSVTDKEISLVCPSEDVPVSAIFGEDGWKSFRVEGQLDFSLVGVLSELSAILAKEKIGIFVTSTYDTDYLFVKKENYARAIAALTAEGHTFTQEAAGE